MQQLARVIEIALNFPTAIARLIEQYAVFAFSNAKEIELLSGLYLLAHNGDITCGVNNRRELVIIDTSKNTRKEIKMGGNLILQIQVSVTTIYTFVTSGGKCLDQFITFSFEGVMINSAAIDNTLQIGTCYGDNFYVVDISGQKIMELNPQCRFRWIPITSESKDTVYYSRILVGPGIDTGACRQGIIPWTVFAREIRMNIAGSVRRIELTGMAKAGYVKDRIFYRQGEYYVPVFSYRGQRACLIQILVVDLISWRGTIMDVTREDITEIIIDDSEIYLLTVTGSKIEDNKVLHVGDI